MDAESARKTVGELLYELLDVRDVALKQYDVAFEMELGLGLESPAPLLALPVGLAVRASE